MVMMKLMKAPADRPMVEDGSVHQIFQQRPGRSAHQDQIEALDASQVHENHDGKRYRDKVAEVSNSPHHLCGQLPNHHCSTQPVTSPALSAAFPLHVGLQAGEWNRFL